MEYKNFNEEKETLEYYTKFPKKEYYTLRSESGKIEFNEAEKTLVYTAKFDIFCSAMEATGSAGSLLEEIYSGRFGEYPWTNETKSSINYYGEDIMLLIIEIKLGGKKK